jgi:NAD(P)-dependent dehydrogenase (short-subunit alcohol dehydrogenase family)
MSVMSFAISNLFDVRGKVALVTGGSSGIGQMIATVFAANGVKVYITGRKPDRLAAAVAEIGEHGECLPLPGDLSKMDEIERLAAELAAREPALHILVNNAGASWGAPIEQFSPEAWDRVMDLNLKGTFFLSQKLLPLLSAAATDDDFARIINLSSVATDTVTPKAVAYGASKAAVEHLTRSMARGFADHRVTVNAISPGWFPSRMNGPLGEEYREQWRLNTPLKRLGTAEDMGGLALFLCSRAGVFINGRTIITDGGETL